MLVIPAVLLSATGAEAQETCDLTSTCQFIDACTANCSAAPTTTLSEGSGYAIIFSTLLSTLFATVGFMLYMYCKKGKLTFTKDEYFSARDTQRAIWLTFSYFASQIGLWVIFAVPTAATQTGMIAMILYALSAGSSLMVFYFMVPFLRRNLPHGTTFWEYMIERFGPWCTAAAGITSLLYMEIYLMAELSSVGTISAYMSNVPVLSEPLIKGDFSLAGQPVAPILVASGVTLIYTSIGGLPLSLLTDRFQGACTLLFTAVICVAAYTSVDEVDNHLWNVATTVGAQDDYGKSVAAGYSLFMGVTLANILNPGFWQRVWAAESDKAAKVALLSSSVLVTLIIFSYGIVGMIGYGIYGDNVLDFQTGLASVKGTLGQGWHVIVLFLGLMMGISSIDTLQSAMQALLSPVIDLCLAKVGLATGGRLSLAVNFVAMLALNSVAAVFGVSGLSILQLFLLADLCCACVCIPMIMGFWYRANPFACFLGMLMGYVTMVSTYAVIGANEEKGLGILTCASWSPSCGFVSGFYYTSTAYAYFLCPFVSGLVTFVFSYFGAIEWKGDGSWGLTFTSAYAFPGFKNAKPQGGGVMFSGQK